MSGRKSQAKTMYFPDRQEPVQQRPFLKENRSSSSLQAVNRSKDKALERKHAFKQAQQQQSKQQKALLPAPPQPKYQKQQQQQGTLTRQQSQTRRSEPSTQLPKREEPGANVETVGNAVLGEIKKVAGPAAGMAVGLASMAATAVFAPAMLPGVAAATLGPIGAAAAQSFLGSIGGNGGNASPQGTQKQTSSTSSAPQGILAAMVSAGISAFMGQQQQQQETTSQIESNDRFTELSDSTAVVRVPGGYGDRSRSRR